MERSELVSPLHLLHCAYELGWLSVRELVDKAVTPVSEAIDGVEWGDD